MMSADRPYARRRGTQDRKLARKPRYLVRTDKRAPEPTRRDDVDAEFRQQRYRGIVKRISWRNPDPRLNSFARKDFHSAPQLVLLYIGGERRKFTLLPQCYQPAILRHIEMLITVQGDGPPAIL